MCRKLSQMYHIFHRELNIFFDHHQFSSKIGQKKILNIFEKVSVLCTMDVLNIYTYVYKYVKIY